MTTFLHNAELLYISIEELGFSPRTYNCLKRVGFNSLEDLSKKSLDDYMKVRNLGRKSLNEVEEKLAEYGIVLSTGDAPSDFFLPGEEDVEVESLELTYRTYTCLKRAGINSLFDLNSKSDEELNKIRNLGRKSFEEIQELLAKHGLKDSPSERII